MNSLVPIEKFLKCNTTFGFKDAPIDFQLLDRIEEKIFSYDKVRNIEDKENLVLAFYFYLRYGVPLKATLYLLFGEQANPKVSKLLGKARVLKREFGFNTDHSEQIQKMIEHLLKNENQNFKVSFLSNLNKIEKEMGGKDIPTVFSLYLFMKFGHIPQRHFFGFSPKTLRKKKKVIEKILNNGKKGEKNGF